MKSTFFKIIITLSILWILVQIAECSVNEDDSNHAYVDTTQVDKRHKTTDGAPLDTASTRGNAPATYDEGFNKGYQDGNFDRSHGRPYRHSYYNPFDSVETYTRGYNIGYNKGFKNTK